MMRKKVTYTNITPIPSFIPRQLAIDILHSHGEIIELNPLVLGYEAIKAPREAPADEFYSTWYEITERIQYIPGIGKLGSGVIKFKGCFHDMPWGLQTHTYAPANVDLRNKWQICGNQPGEPPETRELGLGAPPEGLYLREDIEIKCNMTMVSFVKKEMKASSKILVERLIKKAELLDSGVLHAMMEDGKLKTVNPADRSQHPNPSQSPLPSPKQNYNMPMSPMRSPTFPQNQGGQYVPPNHAQGQNNIVMELPGDFYHPQSSPGLLQPNDHRYSTGTDQSGQSPNPSDGRWSQVSNDYQSSVSSRPSSYASDGLRSPGLDQKQFASELPTMEETREEHDDARKRLEGQQYPDQKYRYNPQDYANTQQYSQLPQYTPYRQGM
ncbi:hypothetical protein BS50DRAFT_380164 [Corynespora cassiicola Philippines]|uniref:DUF7053 domain-containing protein n=1 Tax=Corynespora cassiicola Philippines TaxID=1448308 RepID=A0A2T2NNM2_CORCC|nr:hypothetical protein BS50DRAFT_380164 [Corynespora cassiicola Philippines]